MWEQVGFSLIITLNEWSKWNIVCGPTNQSTEYCNCLSTVVCISYVTRSKRIWKKRCRCYGMFLFTLGDLEIWYVCKGQKYVFTSQAMEYSLDNYEWSLKLHDFFFSFLTVRAQWVVCDVSAPCGATKVDSILSKILVCEQYNQRGLVLFWGNKGVMFV